MRKVLADEHGQHDHGAGQGPAAAPRRLLHRRPARSGADPASGTTATCSPRRSPSAAAPATCSATSSPSGCSACPTTSTSRSASPGPKPAVRDRLTPIRRSPPGAPAMARKDDTPVFKQHQKVVAAHDLPGVAAGTPGKILLINGLAWVRYRVLFEGRIERGHAQRRRPDHAAGVAGRGRTSGPRPSARRRRDAAATPPAWRPDGRWERSMKLGMQVPYAGGFKESAALVADYEKAGPRHRLGGRGLRLRRRLDAWATSPPPPRPSRSARASCRSTPARRR